MSANSKVIITGISGQDAAYLAEFLLKKYENIQIFGTDRRCSERSFWRLKYLGIKDYIKIIDLDLSETSQIIKLFQDIRPHYFYNLAAMSFVGSSFNQVVNTHVVNGMAVIKILDAIKNFSAETRFYQASTSEMFGKVLEVPQTEKTPFYPRSPYGVSKVNAFFQTLNHRESFNLFTTNGILFNHESPLRGSEFVTKKIVEAAHRIHSKIDTQPLRLGNLDSFRDWGFAGDYVKAMNLIIEANEPDDFVVATNKKHSVREFCEKTFSFYDIDINWSGENENEIGFDTHGNVMIEVSKEFYRPAEVELLIGDYSKIKNKLGWEPEHNLDDLIQIMCKFEIEKHTL